ncbi:hypothetical protein L1887_06400 [Cichorium endivia]|nr:hypothetical protein L1887_06400 [Cichorium endivia]
MEIEIISRENITPSSPTPSNLKTYDLSLLDQLFHIPYAPTILYYPNKNGDNFQALERSVALKQSLSETLTQFYPLAGTIKSDLSIDCNDVGANYVVALVHCRLDEFLEHPNHRLINRFLPIEPSFAESSAGNHVTNVQVNVFECGGIAIGLCVSHKIVDGTALCTFLKGWTNMARGVQEVVYPNLTAPSLFPTKSSTWLKDAMMASSPTLLKEGSCSTKRFVFGSDAIARLQARAAGNGGKSPTRVEVVSGFIWKCAMAASKEANGVQKPSRLTHFVNLRPKLADTLSNDFLCNMFWISYAEWLASDDETTLQALVNKVHEGIKKIDVDFVDKAQGDRGYVAMQKYLKEMGEVGSVGSIENYSFTSWCKMGFYEVDFGFGKPSWVTGPVGDGAPLFINLVTLMDTKCGKGIEAWVNLDETEMEILQKNQDLLAYASVDPSPLVPDEVGAFV